MWPLLGRTGSAKQMVHPDLDSDEESGRGATSSLRTDASGRLKGVGGSRKRGIPVSPMPLAPMPEAGEGESPRPTAAQTEPDMRATFRSLRLFTSSSRLVGGGTQRTDADEPAVMFDRQSSANPVRAGPDGTTAFSPPTTPDPQQIDAIAKKTWRPASPLSYTDGQSSLVSRLFTKVGEHLSGHTELTLPEDLHMHSRGTNSASSSITGTGSSASSYGSSFNASNSEPNKLEHGERRSSDSSGEGRNSSTTGAQEAAPAPQVGMSMSQALRMNKELHTVEGSKLVGELLNERKRRNKDHKKRKHANIITFLFGSSDAVFTNTYARALVGALLTVAESKPAPGFMRSRLIPAIEIAIAASQLSVLNELFIPFFIPGKDALLAFVNSLLFVKVAPLQNSLVFNYVVGLSLVFSSWLSLLLLCVLFRYNVHSSIATRAVPTYLRLVTGVLFLPICEAFVEVVAATVQHSHVSRPLWLGTISILVVMLLFLPFCLLISQNKFDSDENSDSLITRQHNRTDLLYLLMKIVITVSRHCGELPRTLLNFFTFVVMFATHYCTHIYWKNNVNRFFNGLYLVFCAGSFVRVVVELKAANSAAHDEYHKREWIGETVFWACFIPIFWIGWSHDSLRIMAIRFRVNDFLVSRLTFLDLADNASLIQKFNLVDQLRSPTRIGRYAQLLASQGEQEEAKVHFERALAADPDHPDNLGSYAMLLIRLGKTDAAPELFERALRRNSRHRKNLELYAAFLNDRENDRALQYYQRSLLTYLEHMQYRDVYANSSDAMFVLQSNGRVLDCNGAAMTLFHARSRADLCNRTNFVDLVHGNKDKLRLRKMLVELDKGKVRNERLHMSMEVKRQKTVINVAMCASRVQQARRRLLHVSVVDITEMQKANDLATQTFEKGASPMIMIDQHGIIMKFNEAAVAFFDYSAREIIGKNISQLMPEPFRSLHNNYLTRYLQSGKAKIIGLPPRNVPVLTRSGEQRLCSLKVNKMTVGGGQGVPYFIGILHDVTKLTEALSLAEACFSEANDPMVVIDERGIIQRWNSCAATTFHYSAEDAIGKDISFIMPEPFRSNHGHCLLRYLETGEHRVIGKPRNVPVITAKGVRLTCSLKVNEIMVGNTRMFLGLLHDVTELIEALSLAEACFSEANDPMVVVDEHGTIKHWNNCATATFKYPAGEAIGQNITFIMPEPHRSQHGEYLKRYLTTGETRVIGKPRDVPVITATGEVLVCSLKVNEIKVGSTRLFVGLLHDVTKLLEALSLAESCFSEANDPMVVITQDGVIHRWNACAAATFQYSANEAIGKNINFLMPEPHRSQHDGYLKHYLQTGERKVIGKPRNVPVVTGKGDKLICSLKVNELAVGTRRYFVGLLHDVTILTQALSLAEACFSEANDPMVVITHDGTIQQWNACAAATFHYSADEAIGQNISFLMPEPHRSQHDGYLSHYLETGERNVIGKPRNVPVVTGKGEKLICSLKVNEIVVEDTKVYVGLLHDVTILTQALSLAEACFSEANDPMVVITHDGTIQQWNACAAATFHYSADEAIGQNINFLMPEPHRSQHDGYLSHYLETGERKVIGKPRNVPVVTGKGETLICSLKVNEIVVGDTKVYVGLLHDVTKLTEALSLAEACFAEANDPMVVITHDGTIKQWNACAAATFHYSADQAIGQNINFLMPKPHRSQHDGYLKHYLQTGERKIIGKPRNVPVLTGKGETLICSLKVNEIVVGDAKVYVGLLHDVTVLTQALSLAEACFSEANDPMVVITHDGTIQQWNACAAATFHYTAEDAIGQNINFLMPEPHRSQHDGYLNHYLQTGERKVIGKPRDVPVVTGKGEKLICSLKVNEIVVGDTKVYVGLLHDVTKLTEALSLAEACFSEANDPMVVIMHDGTIRQWNACAAATFHYTPDEAVGQNINFLMPEPYRSQHDGYLKHYMQTGERKIIGKPRNVPVVTGKGETLICSLKVNEMVVGDTKVYMGLLHDVTKVTEALSLAEACFSEANDPMVVVDEQGVIQRWNACAAETFEYSAEKAIGQNISFLMPEPYRSQHDGYLKHYLQTGERKVIGKPRNVPVITGSGRHLICSLKVNEMKVGDRRLYVGIVDDRTELTISKELTESIFDQVGEAPQVAVSDRGKIVAANKTAAETFGYRKDELTGQTLDLLLSESFPDVEEGGGEVMREFLENGARRHTPESPQIVPVRCKTGALVLCDLSMRTLHIRSSKTGYYLVALRQRQEDVST